MQLLMKSNTLILVFLLFFSVLSSIIPGFSPISGDPNTLAQRDSIFKLGLDAVMKHAQEAQGLNIQKCEILEVSMRLAGGIEYKILFSCEQGIFEAQVFVIIWQDIADIDSFNKISEPGSLLSTSFSASRQKNSSSFRNQSLIVEESLNITNQTNISSSSVEIETTNEQIKILKIDSSTYTLKSSEANRRSEININQHSYTQGNRRLLENNSMKKITQEKEKYRNDKKSQLLKSQKKRLIRHQ